MIAKHRKQKNHPPRRPGPDEAAHDRPRREDRRGREGESEDSTSTNPNDRIQTKHREHDNDRKRGNHSQQENRQHAVKRADSVGNAKDEKTGTEKRKDQEQDHEHGNEQDMGAAAGPTVRIGPMIGTSTDRRDQIGNENPVKRAVGPKQPAKPKPGADSKQRDRHTQRHERDNEHRVTTAAGGTAESTAAAGRTRSADTNARDQLKHENIPKRTPRRKHRLNQDHEPTPATRRRPAPRIPRPNQQTTPTAARSVRQRFISPDHRSTR